MEEAQDFIEDRTQDGSLRIRGTAFVCLIARNFQRQLCIEDGLDDLQVPVTEFMPQKPIKGACCFVKFVLVKGSGHGFNRAI